MKLNDLFTLPLASRYGFPGDPGAVLPICIGDFLSPAVTSSAPEAGGMLPAVLIDTLTWTYCLNAGRSATDAPLVYVEDVLQNPSVYTYNPMNDFQGKGLITTLTFNTDPGGRQVSWRGKGLVDGAGALITNPISATMLVLSIVAMVIVLLPAIRKKRDAMTLPVIMATARADSNDVVEALEKGANDYVTKPIEFDILVARMRVHLRPVAAVNAVRGGDIVIVDGSAGRLLPRHVGQRAHDRPRVGLDRRHVDQRLGLVRCVRVL